MADGCNYYMYIDSYAGAIMQHQEKCMFYDSVNIV